MSKAEPVHDWRAHVTPEESLQIGALDVVISDFKDQLSVYRARRQKIVNRVISRKRWRERQAGAGEGEMS